MSKNLGVVLGLVAVIVSVIALATASSSYSRFSAAVQVKSDEMNKKGSEIQAKYEAVQAKYNDVCALLEAQRKAEIDREAAIKTIRDEYEAAATALSAEKAATVTALTEENAKRITQYTESAKVLDAQLVEAKRARLDSEQRYNATVGRIKEAAELIRFRELQVIYPELRRFDGKKLDINEKYLASVEVEVVHAKLGNTDYVGRQCVAVYDNKSGEPVTPKVKVTFFDEYGVPVDSVDLGWVIDTVGPGERRKWERAVSWEDITPVYWRIEVK